MRMGWAGSIERIGKAALPKGLFPFGSFTVRWNLVHIKLSPKLPNFSEWSCWERTQSPSVVCDSVEGKADGSHLTPRSLSLSLIIIIIITLFFFFLTFSFVCFAWLKIIRVHLNLSTYDAPTKERPTWPLIWFWHYLPTSTASQYSMETFHVHMMYTGILTPHENFALHGR